MVPVIVTYRPIGVVHTPYTEPSGMPIQPSRGRGVRGRVEVYPDFVACLADLDGFSHVILLCHLHRAGSWRPAIVPYLDTVERGLFATRAPSRPNPIGLSVVRLMSVSEASLEIRDVDLLDGTPVLDIKPYVPEFDGPVDIRLGWLEDARRRAVRSDERFDRRSSGPKGASDADSSRRGGERDGASRQIKRR